MRKIRVFLFLISNLSQFLFSMEPQAPAYKQVHAVEGHAVKDLCFISPTEFAVATYKDAQSTLSIYNTKSKNSKCTVQLPGHVNSISSCAGYDKMAIAIGKNIFIVDVQTEKKTQICEAHSERINSVHAHPNCVSTLISGSLDKTVKIWDLRNTPDSQIYRGHKESVTCVRVAGNESYFISGSEDNTTRIWNWRNPNVGHVIRYVAPQALAYNSEGNKFTMCAHYATRYDAKTAALIATFNRNGEQEASRGSKIAATNSLIYSCASTGQKERELVVVGTDDGKMVLFNPENSKVPPTILPLFKSHLDLLAFCPNGSCLVAGSTIDQKWQVFELSNKKDTSPTLQKRSSITAGCLSLVD